jgi:hypothetical protein
MSTTAHTFIDAVALAARLDDARLRLFDCRSDLLDADAGREAYERGSCRQALCRPQS